MYKLYTEEEAVSLPFLTICNTKENCMPFNFVGAKLPFLLISSSDGSTVCACSFKNNQEAIEYAKKVRVIFGDNAFI